MREIVFTLVNVYAPNVVSDRVLFFKKLKTFISQNIMNEGTVLLCGDMNCCQTRVHDKKFFKIKRDHYIFRS